MWVVYYTIYSEKRIIDQRFVQMSAKIPDGEFRSDWRYLFNNLQFTERILGRVQPYQMRIPRWLWRITNDKHIFYSDISVGKFLTTLQDVPFSVFTCVSERFRSEERNVILAFTFWPKFL